MTPYTDEERKNAWQALYASFNELPVPPKEVWKVQAALTRAEADNARLLDLVNSQESTIQQLQAELGRLRKRGSEARDLLYEIRKYDLRYPHGWLPKTAEWLSALATEPEEGR